VRILTVETSTALESAGVVVDDQLVSERSAEAGRGRDVEFLEVVIDALSSAALTVSDLDLIAVSSGPGRFTGLRVGMATAKGLAASSGCAVVAVPTLRALARSSGRAGAVAPLIDARRGEVYGALFDGGRRLVDDFACPPAALPDVLPATAGPVALVGGGAVAYAEALDAVLGGRGFVDHDAPARPTSGALAAIAAVSPRPPLETVEPVYVRGVGAGTVPSGGGTG